MGELGSTPPCVRVTSDTTDDVTDASLTPTVVKSKLVLVGDSACGKTSLIKRYISGDFVQAYSPSGFDTYTSTYDVTDTYTIHLSLWDTSGLDEYSRVRPMSYKDADILLVCYSIGDPESLNNVASKWYPEIRESCPKQPIIVVGCQRDLRDAAGPTTGKTHKKCPDTVSYEQGMKTAKTIDAVMYTEVSAKTSRKSVHDVIEVAAMSAAGCKVDRKNATFRRRRSDFRRKRFSELAEARRTIRTEVAKSCVVM